MRKILFVLLLIGLPALAQNIFNCSSFTVGNGSACDVNDTSPTGGVGFWMIGNATPFALSNGIATLVPFDQGHNAYNMNWASAVDIRAFTTSFTFSPDGQNIAFVIQNNDNIGCCGDYPDTPSYPQQTANGWAFSAGAGTEAAFYQAFGTVNPGWPNRTFGLKYAMDDFLKETDSGFTYSNVQIFETGAPPNDPNDGGTYWWPTDKLSTSPVPLTYPASTEAQPAGPRYTASQSGTTLTVTAVSSGTLAVGQQAFPIGNPNTNTQIITALGTGTGGTGTYTVSASQAIGSTTWWGVDKFISTITYDGSNFEMCLADITAGNNCTSATTGTGTYYTHTWATVDIPQLVDGTTAFVGLSGGINIQPLAGDLIYSWSYTVNTPPSTPSISNYTTTATYTNGQNPPPTPTASPAPGSYSGTQSVTLSSAGSSYICYTALSSLTSTTILPHADNYQGCAGGGILMWSYLPAGSTGTAVGSSGQNCNVTFTGNGISGATALITLSGTNTLDSSDLFPTITQGVGATAAPTTATLSSGTATCSGTINVFTTWTGPQQGTLYSGPVSVPSTTHIYAQAGYNVAANTSCPGSSGSHTTCAGPPSGMANLAYTIGGSSPAATPTFSPVAGTYTGTQSVTLSTTSSGAVICYTTNGTTPATNGTAGCTTGTLYSTAISVSASETVKAIAGGTGYADSSVGSAAYVINTVNTLRVSGKVVMSGKVVVK